MFSHSLRSLRSLCGMAIAAVAATLVAGCTDDDSPFQGPEQPESGYITLSLNCTEESRAYTEEGSDALNENLINSVTLCLWSKGGDKPDDTARPDYVQTFTGLNERGTATLRVPMTQALKNVLFETEPGECHAFVAVNVTPPAGEFTIADLRNMAIGSEFSQRRTQPRFAMDGDGVVTYDRTLDRATGTIDLQRSASKITLALAVDAEVEQSVVIEGKLETSKWRPDLTKMSVRLLGGLAVSTLDPDLDAHPSQGSFFDTPETLNYTFVGNNTDNGNAPGGYDYSWIQDRPFYTYPHRWSAEPGDYAATYMTLAIPWRRVDDNGNPIEGSTWRTCYYQVPVIAADSDPLQLVRNVSYHVYLHVGLLGSFVPDEPLTLDDLEYSAAEWGNVNMDVNIPDVRYLVVDQNDYTVNNETSITIPFYTSHETIVTDATMTFYRYNYDDAGLERAVKVSMTQNTNSENRVGEPVFTAFFDNNSKELRVTHELVMYEAFTANNALVSFTDNDGPTVKASERKPKTDAQWDALMNSINYFKKQAPTTIVPDVNEYSRVEFEITVQHKDIHEGQDNSHNFEEIIRITQYPGMYITTGPNNSGTNYYGGNATISFGGTGAQGNTGINGNYTTAYSNSWDREHMPSLKQANGWTTTIGLSSNNFNFNPNMYLVTVTTLPEGTKYRIADPRSTNINNNLKSSGSGGISSLPALPTNLNNMTDQNRYTLQLITTGVNSSLPQTGDVTPWSSQTYYWNYWYLNNGSWRILASSNYGGPNYPVTVNGFSQQEAIYPTPGTRRTLQYYYPTMEDDDSKMLIAPKFRICSSYAGTTWQLNRELARRRAAAYQELGYPAGRWRLPTFGEVSFIMDLAAQYKIPRLFGTFDATWWYWCAQGLVCVPAKNRGGGVQATLPNEPGFELPIKDGARDCQRARFVYDEWYWGEADLKANGEIGSSTPVYTFTWGDKPF